MLLELTEQGRGLGLVSNTSWSPAMHDADLARFGMLDFAGARLLIRLRNGRPTRPSTARRSTGWTWRPPKAVFVGDKLAVGHSRAAEDRHARRPHRVPFRVEEDPEIVPDARIQTIDDLADVLEAWDRVLEMPVH